MSFPTMWHMRPAKAQINLRIPAVWPEPLLVPWIFCDCQATDWTAFGVSKLNKRLHRLCWVSMTNVIMPHCWKSHVMAHMYLEGGLFLLWRFRGKSIISIKAQLSKNKQCGPELGAISVWSGPALHVKLHTQSALRHRIYILLKNSLCPNLIQGVPDQGM